jgi:hypothetical protein
VESMCHDLWAVCLVNCVPKKRLCVLCVSVFGVTVLVSDACRGWLDNLLPMALFRKPCCFTPRGKDNRLQAVERAANALRYRDRCLCQCSSTASPKRRQEARGRHTGHDKCCEHSSEQWKGRQGRRRTRRKNAGGTLVRHLGVTGVRPVLHIHANAHLH